MISNGLSAVAGAALGMLAAVVVPPVPTGDCTDSTACTTAVGSSGGPYIVTFTSMGARDGKCGCIDESCVEAQTCRAWYDAVVAGVPAGKCLQQTPSGSPCRCVDPVSGVVHVPMASTGCGSSFTDSYVTCNGPACANGCGDQVVVLDVSCGSNPCGGLSCP